MRALVLERFGRMVVEDRPRPVAAEGEVLIQVTAVGICGSDIHGFTGENGRRKPGQVMGHEAAGVLVDPGTSALVPGTPVTFNPLLACGACSACAAGQQQYCATRRVIGVNSEIQAAFAEFVAIPAHNVVPLSPALPVEYGALVEPLAVAFNAVRRIGVHSGSAVLITGGGPIGQSAVLAARAAGAGHIVVSELDADRRGLCRLLDVEVIDPAAAPASEQVLMHIGELADVTIDAVGSTASIKDSLSATKPGGKVALVGMGSASTTVDAFALSTQERSLIGCFCYTDNDFLATAKWVGAHVDDLGILVSGQVPLDQAPEAFVDLAGLSPAAGKILVRPDL